MSVDTAIENWISNNPNKIKTILDTYNKQLSDAATLQQQTESNARRITAKNYITNTLEPQMIIPVGDYLTQHTKIVSNFNLLKNEMSIANTSELIDELQKRLNLELQTFNKLRDDKRMGVIT